MRAMDVGLRLVEGAWSLRLSHFLLIGMASTALYAILALALSYIQGIGVTAASILAFGIAAIFSYAGHKYITFVSGGAHRFELPRFLVLTAVGMILVTALPALFPVTSAFPAPNVGACISPRLPSILSSLEEVGYCRRNGMRRIVRHQGDLRRAALRTVLRPQDRPFGAMWLVAWGSPCSRHPLPDALGHHT